MKAVVLHEYGGPEKLKFEDNAPDPQVSGDTVLIAAAAASVNPIDWKVRSGARQKDFPLSFPGNSWLRCEWSRARCGRECETLQAR
jgi:NADPH:quinone reductase-like Zn-dependent oxidoreductase